MAALSGRYQPLASDEQAVAELGSTGPGTRDHLQGYGQTSTRSRRFAHEDGISTNTSSRWSWLENVERWCMGCRLIQKGVDFVRTNAGLLLVASSQLFFALMNVAVKKLNSLDPPVSALELVIVRMGITYICCLTYLLWRKVPDPVLGPKGVRHLLAIRGFTGFFGLFGVYYSLQYLSLSDATTLTFLAPLTTAISGYFFLGESFHRKEALAGLLSLVGVILIARPEALFGPHASPAHSPDGGADSSEKGTPHQRLVAVGVALIGVLGATGAYTSMRAIGKRAHALHSMSYFSLWCVLTASTMMIIFKDSFIVPTRILWLALLVMIGIFGFLAQALLTMGLQRETAGRGAMAMYIQIIFALILERIFFHVVPSPLSICGTLIIIGSAIYVAITKNTSKTKSQPTSLENDSDSDIVIIDLELGVAEPERTHFLNPTTNARRNASTLSLASVATMDEGKMRDKLEVQNVLSAEDARAPNERTDGTGRTTTLFDAEDSEGESSAGTSE